MYLSGPLSELCQGSGDFNLKIVPTHWVLRVELNKVYHGARQDLTSSVVYFIKHLTSSVVYFIKHNSQNSVRQVRGNYFKVDGYPNKQ